MKLYFFKFPKFTLLMSILLFSGFSTMAQCDLPAYIEAEDVIGGGRGY